MSIVVGIHKGRQVCVAADTQSSFGSNRVPNENAGVSKLRRLGQAVIGTTGWGIYENILDDFLSSADVPDLTSKPRIFGFFLDLWKALHEHYPFVNDQSSGHDDSPFGNLDAAFLVASPGGLFYVASDLSVTQFLRYCAVGSGADFSMGAAYTLYPDGLDAEQIARKSIDAACAFNLYCGGRTEVVTLEAQSAPPECEPPSQERVLR